MSKDFIIQMSFIIIFSGLIFIFPNFFAEGYQYLLSHEYIFILIFDFILLSMYLLIKYNFKIQQSIYVVTSLVILGIFTFVYSYTYGTKIPIYAILGGMFAYMFYIGYKVDKITKQSSQ